jgi:signal transduction histidine kinase
MSSELRPSVLTPFGLAKAIQSHAEEFQETHPELTIHLNLAPDGQRLPEMVRVALFRIYQVSLVNVLRHAEARNVDITLQVSDEEVCLEVKDDGKGFVVPPRWIQFVRKGHLGLVGAVERAEAVGGRLDVHSSVEKGTTIRVQVPLGSPNEMQNG